MSFDRVQRWRLILGKRVEDQLSGSGGFGAGGSGGLLSREMIEMDAALGAVYDVEDADPGKKGGGRRGGGLQTDVRGSPTPSNPPTRTPRS